MRMSLPNECSALVNPVCKFFSVTLSLAKGLWLGGTPISDASPLRLAQHDMFVPMDGCQGAAPSALSGRIVVQWCKRGRPDAIGAAPPPCFNVTGPGLRPECSKAALGGFSLLEGQSPPPAETISRGLQPQPWLDVD